MYDGIVALEARGLRGNELYWAVKSDKNIFDICKLYYAFFRGPVWGARIQSVWMAKTPKNEGHTRDLVDILPIDEESTKAIMEILSSQKITAEAEIKSVVDRFKFSTEETKQHVFESMLTLTAIGALNSSSPPAAGVQIAMVDTDAVKLTHP